MHLQKGILVLLAVVLSVSQAYAINTTSLATEIAIGAATDNMASGLALGITLDSERPTKESYTYELDEKISDGRKEILLKEATLFYRGLFGLDQKISAKQAEILEKYRSPQDRNTILRSLVSVDNLLVEYQVEQEVRDFVESLREISRINEMSRSLIKKAQSYGLVVKDSALVNVMEVQKAMGMHAAIERLEAQSESDYRSARNALAQWAAVELLDLRFDVEDMKAERATTNIQLANRVRMEFAFNVIESTYEILGEKVQGISKAMYQEFEKGRVYEEYKKNRLHPESSKSAWIAAGVIVGVFVGAGAPIADLMANGYSADPLLIRLTDALAPKGHTSWIALAEFGIFSSVLFVEIAVGFAAGRGLVKAIESAVISVRSNVVRGKLHSAFQSSHPMKEALRQFLNGDRPKLCRLVI